MSDEDVRPAQVLKLARQRLKDYPAEDDMFPIRHRSLAVLIDMIDGLVETLRLSKRDFDDVVMANAVLEADAKLLRERLARQAALPNYNSQGKRSRSATDTQRVAALSIMPRTGSQRMRVLAEICEAGQRGKTDSEISDVTGLRAQSVTPRRLELKEGGWIVDSGKRRPTGHGGDGIVWIATTKASAAMKNG